MSNWPHYSTSLSLTIIYSLRNKKRLLILFDLIHIRFISLMMVASSRNCWPSLWVLLHVLWSRLWRSSIRCNRQSLFSWMIASAITWSAAWFQQILFICVSFRWRMGKVPSIWISRHRLFPHRLCRMFLAASCGRSINCLHGLIHFLNFLSLSWISDRLVAFFAFLLGLILNWNVSFQRSCHFCKLVC